MDNLHFPWEKHSLSGERAQSLAACTDTAAQHQSQSNFVPITFPRLNAAKPTGAIGVWKTRNTCTPEFTYLIAVCFGIKPH